MGYNSRMTADYASVKEMNMPFHGAKIALLCADAVVVLLRDDRPDIAFPGHWDLPGGGREGSETPLSCVCRETREELGLTLRKQSIHWGRPFGAGAARTWFFVGQLDPEQIASIVMGPEGQTWRMMRQKEFLRHPRAVPHFKSRLQDFLVDAGDGKTPR
jgi:8-oxo-dGTP diphosphatase